MTETERDEFVRYLNDQYDVLITKIAFEILQSYNQIDDVKQKVLLKLTEKASVLEPLMPYQVASYVCKATKHIALSQYRMNKNYERRKERIHDSLYQTATMDYVDLEAFRGEYGFGEDLWSLMLELPAIDREIMVYRYYYDMSSSEIAALIGTNREQVKKKFQRTRQKLEKMIAERGIELR